MKVALVALCWATAEAFVAPVSRILPHAVSTSTATTSPLEMVMDIHSMMDMTTTATTAVTTATTMMDSTNAAAFGSSLQLAFTDQGQNLAGIFFQTSLLPYLAFLYFLSFRANRIPAMGNFGFQFILLFVLATIPSGIISKLTYETSLANVDYLHGGAEALLTTSNILLVLGFKEATKSPEEKTSLGLARGLAFGACALFAVTCAVGPTLAGVEVHSPFLLGLGDLSPDATLALPWVSHSEPANALSIPTWAIHFSSVLEFLVAMQLVWDFSKATENEKWKGLTWGMLPLHASGICACTYHFFYNVSVLQFLVTMQAGFTCLGNLTCAIAAYRIAVSNGWTISELNPFPPSNTSPAGLVIDNAAAMPLVVVEDETLTKESNAVLASKIVALTIALSYLVKYGELGLDLPFTPNAPVALGMVLGIPAITAATYWKQGNSGSDAAAFEMPKLPFLNNEDGTSGGLSMADVKKYGVSGTVAYVLTELLFWAIAFPVASTALYQTSGHWPDVVNDTTDRATVLGFIFAGANVARLLVPLRLGAALALAPWVDENLLNRESRGST